MDQPTLQVGIYRCLLVECELLEEEWWLIWSGSELHHV